MNFIDLIIIGLLLVIVGLLMTFSFFKDRGNFCNNCLYAKVCNKEKCVANKGINKE